MDMFFYNIVLIIVIRYHSISQKRISLENYHYRFK